MLIITNEEQEAARVPLSEVARVRTRYLRSVSVERDFYSLDALEGYILTPAALVSLERVALGIREPSARAFSITGPYGSGKSAFALFAAKILAPPPLAATALRAQIKQQEPEIAGRLLTDGATGYWPVLVTGGREPLAKALVRGLMQSIYHLPEIASRTVLRKLSQEWRSVIDADQPTSRNVTALFNAACILIKKHHRASKGLVVVADELGKFLEYAALHPDQGDMQVLQELAELAARSGDHPLFLITILHQAFDEYAHKLSPQHRQEWQKVQGRFVDIPFEDGVEEKVRLLSRAVEQHEDVKLAYSLDSLTARQLAYCQHLNLTPKSLSASDFRYVLRQTYPLHPLTLLIAPHLFRRFGQNERSLFSFLSSEEPHGFQEFLRTHFLTASEIPLLRPDHLYDYVVSTLGSSLYSHPTSKLWSETEDALCRVWDKPPIQSRLVKTIGLLHILGEQTRVPPSKEVLRFALADEEVDAAAVDEAIAELEASTLITYRRFKDAYRLYEGSDIDVDARLRDARSHFSQGADAIRLAGRLEANSPVVARRHSYETGTLRFFEVRCCRPEAIKAEVLAGHRADGLLLLCLAAHSSELASAEQTLLDLLPEHPAVVVGVNVESDALHEAAVAVECLLWVQSETQELSKDRVASREVRERLLDATAAFQAEWERLLRPQGASENSSWFYRDKRETVRGYRQLQALLSRACEEAFPHTPRLYNELINRRQISSTAAAARRNLIEAMIERRKQPRLGIKGYPPEASMYASILASTHIHRLAEEEEWGIFPPQTNEDPALTQVWAEIEKFLFDGTLEPKPLSSLHSCLKSQPYGLADGIIPVLLCAVLLHHQSEVAVYEEGRFITELDSATFERMIKRPEDFNLQGCRIAGERQLVLNRFAAGLLRRREEPTLVNVVRQLYRNFSRLPEYALKTKRLGAKEQALRDAFKEGKEPEQLLFVDIPLLLGARPFAEHETDAENVGHFFDQWNSAMTAVFGSYDELLSRAGAALCDSFEVSDWEELRVRSAAIKDHITEPHLNAFVMRASDGMLERKLWLESVAAGVVGRPPLVWSDVEEGRFYNLLPPLVSAFRNAELVAFEMGQRAGDQEQTGLRLSVTLDNGTEEARIVVVPKTEISKIEKLTHRMMRGFEDWLEEEPREVRLAVVARIVQRMLQGEVDE